MNTVNSVSQIKNEKAKEFHAQHLAKYQQQFNKINAKLVFAVNEKRMDLESELDSLKANYNKRLREYIA